MQETFEFKLPSGVMCEITPLLGKHQRILTEIGDKKTNEHERMNRVISSVTRRVGSVLTPDEAFIDSMLAGDRAAILTTARQYSLGFPEQVEYVFTYADEEGKEVETILVEDLPENKLFPFKEMKGSEKVSEYSDIQLVHTLKLPVSGKTVRLKQLTGVGERVISTTRKQDQSAHLVFRAREAAYERKGEKESTWISLDLDNLTFADLTFMRKHIKEVEGQVDTEIRFEHPLTGQTTTVDILRSINFLFPSGSI